MSSRQTSGPNYIEGLPRPQWGISESGSMNSLGQPLVTAGKDVIRADHINGLRLIIDLMYNHSHTYEDSVGSC